MNGARTIEIRKENDSLNMTIAPTNVVRSANVTLLKDLNCPSPTESLWELRGGNVNQHALGPCTELAL